MDSSRNTAQFQKHVAAYVASMTKDAPLWIAGDWGKELYTYVDVFSNVLYSACSTCQQSSHGAKYNYFLVRVPRDYRKIGRRIRELKLPYKSQRCLSAPNPPRSIWVWVQLEWKNAGAAERSAHALLILFDTKYKTQIVFDPDTSSDDLSVTALAVQLLSETRFHRGYTPLGVALSFVRQNELLQRAVEAELDVDEQGVCGIMSLLVALCCIRFNYFNPNHMAAMLMEPVRRNANQVIGWYDSLVNARSRQEINKLILPRVDMCAVFSARTRRLCTRKPCGGSGTFCWQHRWIVLNAKRGGRKCSDVHIPCE